MDQYKFAELPSNSSVAALVTLVVSGWFVVVAGALATDDRAQRQAAAIARANAAAPVVMRHASEPVEELRVDYVPEVRDRIVVEGRRSASL